MKFKLTISDAQLNRMGREVRAKCVEAKRSVQAKMALTYQDCVLRNFGPTGEFRLWTGWHPLSAAYAKKVGRDYATLEVSGRLKSAVLLDSSDSPRSMRVVAENSNVPYATAHQYGNPRGNRGHPGLPAREYFPMYEDGTPTRQVQDLVEEAAREELERIFN